MFWDRVCLKLVAMAAMEDNRSIQWQQLRAKLLSIDDSQPQLQELINQKHEKSIKHLILTHENSFLLLFEGITSILLLEKYLS